MKKYYGGKSLCIKIQDRTGFLPIGTMAIIKLKVPYWRIARDMEIEIYSNGVRDIPDLSKL